MSAEHQPSPQWSDGIPCCRDSCPHHDGKRCRLMGFRPDRICEPAVRQMSGDLQALARIREAVTHGTEHEARLKAAALAGGSPRAILYAGAVAFRNIRRILQMPDQPAPIDPAEASRRETGDW